jgi:2-hydroxychromene-2-carboxylate isomerase
VSVDAAFYFDLRSPQSYLAAERALRVLPAPCEWQPILSPEPAFRCEAEVDAMRESVQLRARALELQPLRWPTPFPYDSAYAMLAATYAKRIGKAVAFALAAFRQAFAGGRPLDSEDNVLIAAAACEIHPAALRRATRTRSIAAELERASEEALALGIHDVPAVRVGERVFVGELSLEAAGELLAKARGL